MRNALNGCRDEATKKGATLRYNTAVKSVDHANASVTLEDGSVIRGRYVVVTCGATTD